jgi:hypothetical protein
MKNYYLMLYSKMLAVALLCMSCNRKENSEEKPTGWLNLNVGISVVTHDVYNNLKAANPSDFQVIIYNSTGTEIRTFDRASDIPENIEIEEGEYYIVASSANNIPAAFENEYYYGRSENFQIQGGQTASVSLTCSLGNIMVTVVYEQTVIDDFDSCTTIISNSGGSLEFGLTETRAGYFDQGPLQIDTELEYIDGMGNPQSIHLSGRINQPEAGKHYEIHIDAGLNTGNASIVMNINDSIETELVMVHPGIGWGDLLITEIMFNPSSLGDAEGEWFEVLNNSGESINMINLAIRRGSNNAFHVISSDLVLATGEYAVLGRTATATNNVDYVYGTSISLANAGEDIIINTYGTNGIDGDIICSVDYGANGFNTGVNGSSLQLDSEITDATAALLGSNWCSSTLTYNTGDLGTPGTINSICQ